MKYTKVAAVAAGTLMALGAATPAFADAEADGIVSHASGFLSGNYVGAPIHIPLNVCGNTVNVFALLNPTFGNVCFHH
ncbi:chaplin [Streptomyces sp. JH14]|uniref:chaplin n=1 Tax=Streptomyces sp. JH14 TaxID=2793630 RepID=UPI0023F86984|nr:chaplin [Streptomyces sp. JH14]MDF6045687.1 chaplin [Streptomyces sp. JH14]